MKIYDQLVTGIYANNSETLSKEDYFQSLQESVRYLRKAYRQTPVHVDYSNHEIQDSYLITYLPHYYQLINKVLIEQKLFNEARKQSLNLVFIGGGPGSEVYGTLKYIFEYVPRIQSINVTVLDLHAESWKHSHKIVYDYLVNGLEPHQSINWTAQHFDLRKSNSWKVYKPIFNSADLVVVQNCINEIDLMDLTNLKENILQIYNLLTTKSSLLMIDLTQSVRDRINRLEEDLLQNHPESGKYSTLSNHLPSKLISINARPNGFIQTYLLTGADGLIPRKNLSYDYSLLTKGFAREPKKRSQTGFGALYEPLGHLASSAPEEAYSRIFVGIDFGTSVTVCSVSYLQEGKIKLKSLPIKQIGLHGASSTDALVPSTFGVDGEWLFGKYAIERKGKFNPGVNYWEGFKDKLDDLESVDYPDSILRDHQNVRINNAKDGLVLFFKWLKKEIHVALNAEGLENREVFYSVSIPAKYTSQKKANLRECFQIAGFELETSPFVYEPICSLISSVYLENIQISGDKKIMVIDLGAGTVDISIVHLQLDSENVDCDLLALERIKNIGGNLINEMIVREYIEDMELPESDYKKLLAQAEHLKIKLCKEIIPDQRNSYELPLKAISENRLSIRMEGDGLLQEISFSFSQFNSIMNDYWSGLEEFGIMGTINKALVEANLDTNQIDDIILSGGGARNPYIQSLCVQSFPEAKVIIPDDIQEQVAKGNALQAFTLHTFGQNIINNTLYERVTILTPGGEQVVFGKGEVAPTDEKVFDSSVIIDNSININWSESSFSVIFRVNSSWNIKKVYLSLSTDLDVECELLTDTSIIKIEPQYNLIKKL